MIVRFWSRDGSRRGSLRGALTAVVLAGFLSLVQGGTLTEIAKATLTPTGSTGVAGGEPAFFLRWPPAIVSSHFGELRFTDPWALAVGAFERRACGRGVSCRPAGLSRGAPPALRDRDFGRCVFGRLPDFLSSSAIHPTANVSRLTAFSLPGLDPALDPAPVPGLAALARMAGPRRHGPLPGRAHVLRRRHVGQPADSCATRGLHRRCGAA